MSYARDERRFRFFVYLSEKMDKILESAIQELSQSHEDRMARKLLAKDVKKESLERVSSYVWEQLHLGNVA